MTVPVPSFDDPEINTWWNGLDTERKVEWIDSYRDGINDNVADTVPAEKRDGGPSAWIVKDARSGSWDMSHAMHRFINRRGFDSDQDSYWDEELAKRNPRRDSDDEAADA